MTRSGDSGNVEKGQGGEEGTRGAGFRGGLLDQESDEIACKRYKEERMARGAVAMRANLTHLA